MTDPAGELSGLGSENVDLPPVYIGQEFLDPLPHRFDLRLRESELYTLLCNPNPFLGVQIVPHRHRPQDTVFILPELGDDPEDIEVAALEPP